MQRLHPLTLAMLLTLATAPASGAQLLDRIVAVVNDDVITQTELERRLQTVKQDLRQQRTMLPPPAVLEQQVLDRMIRSRLQIQAAEKAGIRVGDEELNKTLSRIAQDNGLSLAEFRQVLEKDGFDFANFREDIRHEIMIARLQQREVKEQVTVSEQEIQDLLAKQRQTADDGTEYRLGHILITVPEAASPQQIQETRQQAQTVVQELRQGADFHQKAVAVSNGQQALEGGDLGWRTPSELPTPFVDAVTAMSVGEVTEPIRTASGFHIVKLLERKQGERHFVTQRKARHILIRPNEIRTDEDVRLRLQQLRRRLQQGEDFAALARAHSDDSTSASEGGSLGWVSPGEMVPKFEEKMQTLDKGEISEPFQTRFGWHIVQITDQRRQDNTDKFLRNQARETLRQRKVEEELQNWFRRLRDQAYIEVRLDPDSEPVSNS